MLLVLPTSAAEVKEGRELMRRSEMHLFLECFPEEYTENEAATATANTLKRAPNRKRGSDRKKGLEVTSADFSADEIENDNSLIGLKEEEDTSSDSFDEM